MDDARLGERDQNNDDSVLHLVVHLDENVNMVQIGHLQHWFSGGTSEARVHAPPSLTSPHVLAQLVSGLFMFPNLRILNLTLAQPTLVLRQTVFCAIAELSQLRECYVQGGALLPGCDGIKLEVLGSLRKLEKLELRPSKPDGLDDDHVAGLTQLSPTVRSLAFRGSTEGLSDDGIVQLSSLHGLTELRILPLGLAVTRDGMSRLLSPLTSLQTLAVGLQQAGQICTVREQIALRSVSIIANDPEAADLEWCHLVTNCTLCLTTSLVTLRLGLLKAQDASFMLALDTLTNLTELKFAVAPATMSTPPFRCDITCLGSLSRLQSLDVACTSRIALPFTPRTVSVAALAWPKLNALSLSVMGRRELVPEALALLDLLSGLRALGLSCALDFSEDDQATQQGVDPGAGAHVPVDLRYLPRGLQRLQLERAQLLLAHEPQFTPGLHTLQLDDCLVGDACFQRLLEGTPGLQNLELNCVQGLSAPGLYTGISQMTGLQRLVLCGLASAHTQGTAAPQGQGAHRWSVEKLSTALSACSPTLVHLEWAPGEPLTAAQLLQVPSCLASFRSLQFLYLDATSGAGNDWQADVRHKLPLCTTTADLAATVMSYDIYSDAFSYSCG